MNPRATQSRVSTASIKSLGPYSPLWEASSPCPTNQTWYDEAVGRAHGQRGEFPQRYSRPKRKCRRRRAVDESYRYRELKNMTVPDCLLITFAHKTPVTNSILIPLHYTMTRDIQVYFSSDPIYHIFLPNFQQLHISPWHIPRPENIFHQQPSNLY